MCNTSFLDVFLDSHDPHSQCQATGYEYTLNIVCKNTLLPNIGFVKAMVSLNLMLYTEKQYVEWP